ncbi:MAG: DUF1003 domain-containing protein [Dehalococcoidia bacterium]
MSIRRASEKAMHPALIRENEARAANLQNRIADAITTFAGSMAFVYIHIVWFIIWVITQPFGDKFPFGLLTMIVSLEAIFLSTFVMISQNRADVRRQALADHQWALVQTEGHQNEELLTISQQLLDLTQQVHTLTTAVHNAVMNPGGAATVSVEPGPSL